MSDLCFMPAHQLKSKLLHKDISASELLELFIKQISLHNQRINALVTLDLEAATRTAKKLDDYLIIFQL